MKISNLYNEIIEGDIQDAEAYTEDSAEVLLDAYRQWRNEDHLWHDIRDSRAEDLNDEDLYEAAVEILSRTDYDERSLRKYIPKLELELEKNCRNTYSAAYQIGIFTSAAINLLENETVEIPGLTHIQKLGYKNSENLVIQGDVPQATVGSRMDDGNIHVKGDVDSAGCDMCGGEIIVEGSASSQTGNNMSGGTIVVKGGTLGTVGNSMENGKVRIKGNASSVGTLMQGGEIYIEGDVEDIAKPPINGKPMSDGQIRVEGEIENLHRDNVVGGSVYQNQNGNWQQVYP